MSQISLGSKFIAKLAGLVFTNSTIANGDTALAALGKLQGQLNAVNSVPTGAVSMFAMNTPPTGWVKANGALVSRTTYATLFAAIGTVYGVGDGSTTFGLPDLRGEFLRGWDDGRGIDAARALGSAQAADIAPHTHGSGWNTSATELSGYGLPAVAAFQNRVAINNLPGTATAANTGSETRPRNVALMYCIKY
jgi:microcystin-dependent protein